MSDTQDTTTEDRNESFREKMRRDHFPVEKGDNQQDDDYQAELNAERVGDMRERDVKWPEVDSQEALDERIDQEQSDKEQRIRDAAREADEEAAASADNG